MIESRKDRLIPAFHDLFVSKHIKKMLKMLIIEAGLSGYGQKKSNPLLSELPYKGNMITKVVLHRTSDGGFHAADLSEFAHTAEAGIARVGAFAAVEVVTYAVSVVRTKRDGALALLLHFEHRAEELIGVEITFEGPFLIEIAFGSLGDCTEVDEIDSFAKPPHHTDEVMMSCASEGAGAEA